MHPYYQDDSVTIYHGDCRDVFPSLGEFDAVVTDPPYGVNLAGKYKSGGGGYLSYDDSKQNVADEILPRIRLILDAGKPTVLTPGRANALLYPRPNTIGTIFYPSGAGCGPWGFICSQPIYYYGKDPYLAAGLGSRPDSFASSETSDVNGHPCPKPIKAMRWLVIKASLEGQTVVDPFMGSGTTLRAAKDCQRKAIGIEIEERYCEIAALRMAQEVLFA